MASSCTREGSGWTSRRISSLKGWLSIRTDCAEMWWSHYPWKILWNVWTWYFVLCFYSHGGVWSKVGLKYFGALSNLSSLPILLFSLTQDQYTLEKVRPIWNDCYCFPNCTDCPKSAQTSLLYHSSSTNNKKLSLRAALWQSGLRAGNGAGTVV